MNNDLISRQALIDFIDNWYNSCNPETNPRDAVICDVLDSVVWQIQDQETVGKLCDGWDSCGFRQKVVEELERQAEMYRNRAIHLKRNPSHQIKKTESDYQYAKSYSYGNAVEVVKTGGRHEAD